MRTLLFLLDYLGECRIVGTTKSNIVLVDMSRTFVINDCLGVSLNLNCSIVHCHEHVCLVWAQVLYFVPCIIVAILKEKH